MKYCDEHYDQGVERCPFMDADCTHVTSENIVWDCYCCAPIFELKQGVFSVYYNKDGSIAKKVDRADGKYKNCPIAGWNW